MYSKNFPPIKKRIRKEGLTTDSNDKPQSRKGIRK